MADTSTSEKMRYMKEFIRQFNEIEEAMEPFKQHRRELRKEYKDNGWLSTEEMRSAVKAYRILKTKGDIDEIYDAYTSITGLTRESGWIKIPINLRASLIVIKTTHIKSPSIPVSYLSPAISLVKIQLTIRASDGVPAPVL